jgi:signal-transduction protein with cAMP-binding, CBS, and nucleotidyltransferase domain
MPNDILNQFPLFDGFSEEQMDLLRPLFVPSDCYEGTVLFDQGEPATYFYLVYSGEVAIHFPHQTRWYDWVVGCNWSPKLYLGGNLQ